MAVKKEKERIQPLIPSVKDTTRSSTVAFAFALSVCPPKLVVFVRGVRPAAILFLATRDLGETEKKILRLIDDVACCGGGSNKEGGDACGGVAEVLHPYRLRDFEEIVVTSRTALVKICDNISSRLPCVHEYPSSCGKSRGWKRCLVGWQLGVSYIAKVS